ncbi:MAG: ATP-binding cassette domain-containing protein [Burkholderiales bacterium]|jgi:tungstate transport system ATP-binding protein
MADLLALRQACVVLGERLVLHDLQVNLTHRPVTAVLGANGAGKSVLLRTLHGLLPLAKGQLHWPRSVRQAMVFQRPALLRRSVRGNLEWAFHGSRARLARVCEQQTEAHRINDRHAHDRLVEDATALQVRIERLLSQVGLLDQADRPARLLSGGEQQRLALARAWLLQPELLLLDEPCASVDPASMSRIEQCLRDMTAQGITLILTTHLLGQARRLSDQIVFLHEGCLTEVTPTTEFFNQPRSDEARLFLEQALP